MGTVIISNKNEAEKLIAKGFKCTKSVQNNITYYEFIETKALAAELNKSYGKNNYCKRKTINY